jgi:acetyl-CoA carboxylase biotin carboxyl carrier protein
VGLVEAAPPRGSFVDPERGILTLRVLGRRRPVRLPAGIKGWVTESMVVGRMVPVAYDEPLLRVSAGASPEPGETTDGRAGSETAGTTEEGLVPVRSPSQGVFYRRPNPESPAYAEEGAEVEEGSVLGLVEVMKVFHRITYGGPGLPARGTVAKILVDDAAEVEFEQTLFLIRPAGD